MAGNVRVVMRPAAEGELKRAVAKGLLNYLHALEGAAKANAPVRGGDRSFNMDQKKGGTLRRSIHAVVYVDGKRIAGATRDQNKGTVPDYVPGSGIVGYVGTNVDYGVYVHNGTVHMPARPFLLEALAETRGEAPGLIEDGTRKALG